MIFYLFLFYLLKIKEEIIKNKIIPIDKARRIKIEDLKALSNIENISKEEEERLKELGLIRLIGRKITLTHSGVEILKVIRKYVSIFFRIRDTNI
jgi:hypothetical protein